MKYVELGIGSILSVMTLLMLAVPLSMKGQEFRDDSVKIGGKWRKFTMLLPESLKPGAPLVFVLHGYGGKVWRENPLAAPARNYGFALCIPEGLKDPKGKRGWNVGYPSQQGWKQDDVKDLLKMASTVQQRYGLSRKNTFMTGMSNGGEMCYLMAYSNQNTFKAVATIAGLTMEWMYRTLHASRSIPLMEVHGTEDRTSEWTGDLQNKGGWGAYLPVPIAVNYWVSKNRCMQEKQELIPSLNPESGHYTIKHEFSHSPYGCDVWLYEVVGAGHKWHTDDLNTGEEVWKFFSKYVE
ncbi:MAG: prolyl oligopeptidase family serine peptidase [Bacteroidaceae bacterium]|nr:prolyl oligopeptidase family serine peptidase [Bacteroidaceae bacterium]